jgi:hypothetical protein
MMMDGGCWMLDGNGWLDVKEEDKQGQQAGVRWSNMAPRATEGTTSAQRIEPASSPAAMTEVTKRSNSSSELKTKI